MEEDQLKSLLSDLKSSSQTCVYKALLKIRQEVIVTTDGIKKFKDAGGIFLLVSMLHKPNERILDVVLSILGNCCMDRSCAAMVIKWKGLRHIVNIIKSIASNSILCRACRVVGNISQFKSNVNTVLKESDAVCALNTLLTKFNKDDASFKVIPPTLLMIIRALRLLWNGYNSCYIIRYNVIKNVTKVLIKYTPLWLKNEEKELLKGVLRCILCFLGHSSFDCFILLSDEGNGFQCLVSLISFHPYIVTKIITNFFGVTTTRSQICLPDAVSKIVTSLKQHTESNPGEKWPQNELSALCLFCKYEMGQIEVSNAGGLPVLLSFIKNCPDRDQLQQVLHALVRFIYNETSLNILLNEGLVSVVVQLLGNYIKYMKCYHEEKAFECNNSQYSKDKTTMPVKSNKNQSPEITAQAKRVIDDDREENLYNLKKCRIENNSSPTLSDYQLSPQPSSSCYSPVSSPERVNCDSESDDSVHYSPVCSDSEPEDKKSVNFFSLVPSVFESCSDQSVYEDEDYFEKEEKLDMKNTETNIVSSLLILLSRAAYMEGTDLSFPHSDTLDILLRYVQLGSKLVSRAARILLCVVSRWDYFIILLQNKFIITIYNLMNSLPHTEFCKQCYQIKKFLQTLTNNFTTLAEDGYGTGQISHYFVKGNSDFKELLSIEIPYLIQSKHLLRVFFIRYGGLELLLNVIIEKKTHHDSALTALGILSTKLKIKDPKCNSSMVSVDLVDGDYKIEKNDSEIVTFQLDDSSIVHAKKDVLVKKSDFFRTLLTGDFKESKEDVVCLKNVTQDGLKYLLVLLEYMDQNSEVAFPLCLTLSVVLEVLVLLDRYLLENLADTLTQIVLEQMLVADTAAQVYAWSIDSNTDILRIETIAFGLAGDITMQERVHIFNSVKQIGYLDQFIDDIRQLLNRYLKIDV